MSMFTQFNGPQSLSGASAKDMLALINAYTELATELHEHMQKTVGFAESSNVEGSKVTGFVHGIQEVINTIQSKLNEKAALADFSTLSTAFGKASDDLNELMEHIYEKSGGESSIDHRVGVLESAKDNLSERTEDLEGSVKDINTSLNGGNGEKGIISALAGLSELVGTLDEHAKLLAAEGTNAMTATFEKVVSSARYLLGTLYAKKYIDFTCWHNVSAQFAGTGTVTDAKTSGLYLLGKMSTNWEDDDNPSELPKPCRVYVKYTNTKQMDAIIDATVSDGKGSIQAIVSKSEGLFGDLRFHILHGTSVSGKACTYIALSTTSLGGIATLNIRVAGVNFIPLDADGAPRASNVLTNYASTSSMSENMTSAMLTSSPQIFSTLALDELTDTEGRTIFKVVQPEDTSDKVLEIGSGDFTQVQFLKRPTVQNDKGERHAFVTDEDVDSLAALPVGNIIQWPTFEEVMEGDTVVMRRATNVPKGWHATDGSTILVEGNEAIAKKGLLPYTNSLEVSMVLPLQDFSIIKISTPNLASVLSDVETALDLESVNNRISKVIEDYQGADNKLDGRLETAEGNIRTLRTDLEDEISDRSGEVTRLEGLISDEETARKGEDSRLGGLINANTEAIRTERETREGEDTAIRDDLSTKASEIAANVKESVENTVDGKINDAVNAEASRATESERAIEQSVSAAEDRLNRRIDTEASDRKTADSALVNFLQNKVVYANRDELPNVTPDAAGHTWQTGDTAVIFTGTSITLVTADVADSIVTWH